MNIITIEATDIPDAWFQCIYNLFDYGRRYVVQKGSFEGETRLEFDWATIVIDKPYAEPYDLMLPQIPAHLNIPNPVESGYVEQYLPYLMTAEKQPEEDYTYGKRLCKVLSCMDGLHEIYESQIDHWIGVLKKTPNTNQAVLQIAQPDDFFLDDPPCLRQIDLRVRDGRLIFYPYFRSWDAWGGFPANLAGIAVLQKYMADEIGIDSGLIVAASKGLHIYKYVEEIARIRANKA